MKTFAGTIAVALTLSASVAGARTLTIDVKRADVQAYVPYVLDHPTENFGLVLGSLTG